MRRWISLAVAIAVAGLVLARRASVDPAFSGEPLPTEIGAARSWLAVDSGDLRDAWTRQRWAPLMAQGGIARWYRARIPASQMSPGAALAVATSTLPSTFLGHFSREIGLDPELLALLLYPEGARQVAARCPALPETLRPLCDPAVLTSTEQRVDGLLAEHLGDLDPFTNLWAVEAACGLGARGERLGAWAREGQVPAENRRTQQARGITVRACTLQRAEAVAELRALLQDPDTRLGLLASAELARLDAQEATAEIGGLADRLEGNGDGIFARWAEGALKREQDVPEGGL